MTQIELHVPDFGPVREYYSKLSFTEVKPAKNDPEYLIMWLGDNVLRFWPGTSRAAQHPYFKKFPADTPHGYGVELIIMVDDVAAYYQRVKAVANVVEPLKKQPWGLTDFRAADPNGYYLRFTTKHNVLNTPKTD